jgi:hypothetical protein
VSWWYAKRFLHPDVIAAYEYIFIWDEDLGVEHFNGETYKFFTFDSFLSTPSLCVYTYPRKKP